MIIYSTNTAASIIAHTRTLRTTVPIQTLYSVSTFPVTSATSSSILPVPTASSTTSISPSTTSTTALSTVTSSNTLPITSQSPLTTTSTSSGNDVVIVTQYTTVPPSSSIPSSSSLTSSILPSSPSIDTTTGAFDNAGSGSLEFTASPMKLSAGAIAGELFAFLLRAAKTLPNMRRILLGIAVGGLVAILLLLLGIILFLRRGHQGDERESSLYEIASSNEKSPEERNRPEYINTTQPGTNPALNNHIQPDSNLRGLNAGSAAPGFGAAAGFGVAAGLGAGGIGGASGDRRSRPVNPEQRNPTIMELTRNSRPSLPPLLNSHSDQPSRSYLGRVPESREPNVEEDSIPINGEQRQTKPAPSLSLGLPRPPVRAQEQSEHREDTTGLSRSSPVDSVPPKLLGRGSGYASPMKPTGPDGKPVDHETFQERQNLIANGFNPSIQLTPEQQARRDSQLHVLTIHNKASTQSPKAIAVIPQSPPKPPQTLADIIPSRPPVPAASASASSSPHHTNAPPTHPLPALPLSRTSYQLYQPEQGPLSHVYNPVRASLLSPSLPISTPVAQEPSFDRAIPASSSNYARPLSSPPSHRYSFQSHSPSFDPRQSAYGLATSASNEGSSASIPRYSSLADDLYGGLTTGLSERDIARISHRNANSPRR